MSELLDGLGWVVAAAIEVLTSSLAGTAPSLLLASLTLTLVAFAALAIVAGTCRNQAVPTAGAPSLSSRTDANPPVLHAQSDPNAAGRIRSRAPNFVSATA